MVQTCCSGPRADPGAALRHLCGYFDPDIPRTGARQGENQRETSGNKNWQPRALQKASKGQQGATPQAGKLQCERGNLSGLIGVDNLPSWGGEPMVFRGINLLMLSSKAELPIASSVSHWTRGARQKTPLVGNSLPSIRRRAAPSHASRKQSLFLFFGSKGGSTLPIFLSTTYNILSSRVTRGLC